MRKALVFLFLACSPLIADDDSFAERFADPATRSLALTELIPDTRSAYFHTALNHQLAGREAEFHKTIADWKAASEREKNPVPATGRSVLENRQLLIDYKTSPDTSLAELIRRLDLKFDDTRPDAAAAAESLPTRIDPALITESAFEKAATNESPQSPYTEYEEKRLYRELDQVEEFNDAKIRWFIEHLDRADLPGVVPLIDRALGLDRAISFTGDSLLRKLSSRQLESLLSLHPDLRAKDSFAISYLAKLRPGSETDFTRDRAAHAGFLTRCRDFAVTLPPSQNSLKAHILYHHLRLQRELGNFPKADFLSFLALPRQRHPILRIPENPAPDPIRLDVDFTAATACPPVRDDRSLIESYLQHFLALTDSAADFAPFVPESRLARLHAEARLLAGENPDHWGRVLGPVQYKELQQDARIGFAPGAPVLLDSNADVSLSLDLKNTPDLLIRIYELDLPSQLSRLGTEPDVGIDLDGLVPHHERRIAFTQAPIVLHRETIGLPELTGPGAWLVDFVSGQVSARALIRKGQLIAFPERTATGQTLRIFDENGSPVPGAGITLGRETFNADAAGLITIPNSPNQPVTRGIVQAGKLAAPVSLGSRSDSLALDTRILLEREQLLADQEARLHLRIRLTNHGREIPLERIKDPAIVLKAELLGGVTTERVIAENLSLTPVLEVPFQVPADLLKLTLTLRGTVTPATGGDPLKLSDEATYQINSDLKLARVGSAFFSPTATGHRLEVRGRNGEPLPSRSITLKCHRFDYKPHVTLQLRSDENGRVNLGKLDTIDYLEASGPDIAETLYGPQSRILDYTSSLQLPALSEIRLPLAKPAAAPDHLELSLLETIGNQPVRDHFDKLAIEDGQLVIRNLPPGDFVLTQGDETTDIRISPGIKSGDLLVSNTRILPLHSPLNPTVASATTEGDELRIQLRDYGPDTRVSVIGKRYLHEDWYAGSGLYPFPPALPDSLSPGFLGCGFLTERRLSDEMRYILDRRSAKTFPGSLLPRPGLLLHRWTDEDLSQDTLLGGGGEGGRPLAAPSRRSTRGRAPLSSRRSDSDTKLPTVCDFLEMPAAVKFNLSPDANGSLTLPLGDFTGSQFLEITATDAFADDMLRLPLPASDTPLRDRRIARPLDPKQDFIATRSAALLKKGATASIENLLDADWRAFTTLTEAHQFLYGMNGDDRLREFVFLTEWPSFTEAQKLDLLAKHHCHEIHLFLARKDRPFFEKHVKPLLAQKPEPQFMDDWLLGRDLNTYLRPYAWERLNAAEKALLAQALPDTRKRIARELSLRWELEAPSPDAETTLFTQTLRGSDLALQDSLGLARRDIEESYGLGAESAGVAYLTEKLRRIIIPRIDFEDTTVEEAIDFLRLRSAELDTLELDPSRKGMNFIIRRPRTTTSDDNDPGALRIRELRLRNVPLATALKYICDQTKLRFKTDDYAVTLVPQTETGEDIVTRTFRVPPDFADALDYGGDTTGSNVDPFAEPAPGGHSALRSRAPISELLKRSGIAFPEGSSVTLGANGILLVTSTPTELDKIEALTMAVASSNPGRTTRQSASGFSTRGFEEIEEEEDDGGGMDPFASADPFAAPSGGGAALLARPAPPLLFPDRTRLWREANYDRNTAPTDETLIPLNRFWLDLAAWDGKDAFLSPHFNACSTTANDALMCLAMLDLPFKAGRPEVTVDGSTLRVKAREPMLLFYKDTRRTEKIAPESPLLLRQSFSPLAEKFRIVDGHQVENPVTGDFRPGVPYSTSLVVTNPTGIGRRIDLLAQIPAGSIPLEGKPATLSSTVEIEPHGVLMQELAFYFPAAGDFAVYPLHVNEDGTVLAHTGQRTLRVSNDPEKQDAASWSVLASEGSNEEILSRLLTANLDTINLAAIRWRLQNKDFFLKVSKILSDRLHFSKEVAAYAFHHNDPEIIRTYLENSEAVRQLGQWLDSPLLDVRPRMHHDWETLEFDPLINPRAHRFGDNPRMTHEAARRHYQNFLGQLAWKPALDASDELTLTAYLFLQDRIGEALARFEKIDPAKLPGRVNYDYLHAVALFYQEAPAKAKAIAAAALPTLPPGLWRARFQTVIDQADEIVALANPAENAGPAEEYVAPQLDIALADDGKLTIKHRALDQATLLLFSVDLEVLFSKDPFLRGEGANSSQPTIRPNEVLEVPLAKEVTETTIELPVSLRQGNVLVAAESGSTKLLRVLDSRALELRHTPLDRTVQVLDAATRKPLAKTYVKVFAEDQNGEIVFHKDGYTDLRGKFDYLSSTNADPSEIKRVALLLSHPENGARTVVYER